MAKIKFGDYLKSKKQKEAVYESDESIVKRVKALIESDSAGQYLFSPVIDFAPGDKI